MPATGNPNAESVLEPMKLAPKIVFIVVALFACWAEDLYVSLGRLKPGDSAPITFRADRPFDFDQAKAFGGERNLALSQYVPLYIFSSANADLGKKKMQDLIATVSDARKKGQMDAGALAGYVKKEFGVELTWDAAKQLTDYPELQNLLEGMLAIENTIMQRRILEEYEPLRGKGTAEVLYPQPVGTVAYPASEFLTLEKAREILRKQADQVFWQVDQQVLAQVVAIASAALSPNLKYDRKENDRRIEEIMHRYPSKVIHYDPGEVLVSARNTLTEEDVLLLAANRQVEEKDFYASVSWVVLTIVILTVLYAMVLSRGGLLRRGDLSNSLHFAVLTMSILLFEAFLLFTPLPVHALPIGLIPLVLIMLDQSMVAAACTTLLGAAVAGLICGRNVQIFIYFIVGGLTALLASRKIRRRSQIIMPCAAAGAVCGLMAISFGLDWQAFSWALPGPTGSVASVLAVPGSALLRDAGWAVLGGLCAGPLALAVLPLLELVLRTTSTFKINTWTNLEHPLLKELLNAAPGTYQHTMSVANLARAAGEAIGANVPLLRAGSYFHDIGKISDPAFFVENQSAGANPHDGLDPLESARIIIDHVNKGILIGEKAKLPRIVLDFIPQHHGTQVAEYFWNKARQNGLKDQISEEHFRYRGPRPQSIEAAILMIVDAVEAASRTLPEKTRAAVEALVRHIIEKRIEDDQFDECKITTEDLARVRGSLVDTLEAAFHSRVQYPWQEEEADKVKNPAIDKA